MLKDVKINNINVYRFLATHNLGAIHAVIQFLEAFKCGCDDLLDALNNIESDRQERQERTALARKEYHEDSREEYRRTRRKQLKELPPLRTIVGTCPRCNKVMKGEPQRSCEKMEKAPVFYAECQSCSYYYEMWKHYKTGKIWREEEGG